MNENCQQFCFSFFFSARLKGNFNDQSAELREYKQLVRELQSQLQKVRQRPQSFSGCSRFLGLGWSGWYQQFTRINSFFTTASGIHVKIKNGPRIDSTACSLLKASPSKKFAVLLSFILALVSLLCFKMAPYPPSPSIFTTTPNSTNKLRENALRSGFLGGARLGRPRGVVHVLSFF